MGSRPQRYLTSAVYIGLGAVAALTGGRRRPVPQTVLEAYAPSPAAI